MTEPGGTACYCCGEMLDANNLAWDFVQPDDLGKLSARKRRKVVTFESRVFIVAKRYGAAARVILPISLDTGHTVTLGVWVALDDPGALVDAFERGAEAWVGYTFTGTLLNAVQPWPETSRTQVTAKAFEDGKLARVVDAEDPLLKRVLTEKWPHRTVVEARRTRK